MSANALYSIVNGMSSRLNQFSQELAELKERQPVSSETAAPTVITQTTVQQYDDGPLRAYIDKSCRMLEESVKRDFAKEKSMLETTISHKLEQYMSRLIKEKIDMLREELTPVPVPVPVPTPSIPTDPTPSEVEAVLNDIDLSSGVEINNDFDIDIKSSVIKRSRAAPQSKKR